MKRMNENAATEIMSVIAAYDSRFDVLRAKGLESDEVYADGKISAYIAQINVFCSDYSFVWSRLLNRYTSFKKYLGCEEARLRLVADWRNWRKYR